MDCAAITPTLHRKMIERTEAGGITRQHRRGRRLVGDVGVERRLLHGGTLKHLSAQEDRARVAVGIVIECATRDACAASPTRLADALDGAAWQWPKPFSSLANVREVIRPEVAIAEGCFFVWKRQTIPHQAPDGPLCLDGGVDEPDLVRPIMSSVERIFSRFEDDDVVRQRQVAVFQEEHGPRPGVLPALELGQLLPQRGAHPPDAKRLVVGWRKATAEHAAVGHLR